MKQRSVILDSYLTVGKNSEIQFTNLNLAIKQTKKKKKKSKIEIESSSSFINGGFRSCKFLHESQCLAS